MGSTLPIQSRREAAYHASQKSLNTKILADQLEKVATIQALGDFEGAREVVSTIGESALSLGIEPKDILKTIKTHPLAVCGIWGDVQTRDALESFGFTFLYSQHGHTLQALSSKVFADRPRQLQKLFQSEKQDTSALHFFAEPITSDPRGPTRQARNSNYMELMNAVFDGEDPKYAVNAFGNYEEAAYEALRSGRSELAKNIWLLLRDSDFVQNSTSSNVAAPPSYRDVVLQGEGPVSQ